MSRTKKAAAGFVFSVLQFGTQILLQAVLAPVILYYAGRETLGTFAIISQALSLLALLDFGFSLSVDRFLSQSFGKEDEGQRFRDVFTTSRTFVFISNSLFAIIVFICSRFVSHLFGFSAGGAQQARHALELVAVWALVRTPIAQFLNALFAVQDLAFANGTAGILNAFRLICSLVFIRLHWGLVGLTAAGIVTELVAGLIYRARFKALYPKWMPSWGIPKPELFREMFSFGFHSMFINASDLLLYNSGNLIVGKLAGPAAVSTYYSTYMPGFYGYNLVVRLSDNAAPAVNELIGREHHKSLRDAYVTLSRITSTLAFFLAGGLLLFNRPLVHLWVGDQQYGGTLLTTVIACFAIVISVQHINMIYSMAFGWVKLLTKISICEGVVNVALAFWLGSKLGLGGVLLSTLIVITPKTIFLSVKITKHLGLYFDRFFYQAVFIPFIFVFLGFLTSAAIVSRIQMERWPTFLFAILLYVVTVGLVSLAIPSTEERTMMLSVFRNRLMRVRPNTAI